jgi:hypothetical protein
MDERAIAECAVATVVALNRVDLERCDQIRILELCLEWLRTAEEVDEASLTQLVGVGEEVN